MLSYMREFRLFSVPGARLHRKRYRKKLPCPSGRRITGGINVSMVQGDVKNGFMFRFDGDCGMFLFRRNRPAQWDIPPDIGFPASSAHVSFCGGTGYQPGEGLHCGRSRLDLVGGARGSARQIDQSSFRTELWRRSFACHRGRAMLVSSG